MSFGVLMACRGSEGEVASGELELGLSRAAVQVQRQWRKGALATDAPPAPLAATQTLLAPLDAGLPASEMDGEPPPADAGPSIDAGAPPNGDGAPSHPGVGEPPDSVAPLPRDIVAQSRLPFHGIVDGGVISRRAVWRLLYRSRAICLGELHDDPFHHNLQRRVLRGLAERLRERELHEGLAIGYEMFQRPFQEPLSAYMRGELGEEAFLAQTEYAQRWGGDLALYRPLFEANRAHRLPALALNAPTELTRQIGREGIESLTPELAALLPELDLDDTEHRAYIFGLFGLTPEHPAAASLENIYRAQVTWDETMAQTASEWLAFSSRRRVLAFAGVAHCHESAIPRRVTRRTGLDMLSVAPVFASELDAAVLEDQGYDLLVVLED